MFCVRNLISFAPARAYTAFVSRLSTSATSARSNRAASEAGWAASMAVSRQGTLSLDPSQSAPILEQPPRAHSRLRTLVLNRQSALNALNLEMLHTLHARISALERASTVDAILLTAAPGRAFCAGGDVRYLYDAGADGNYAPAEEYFHAEYCLDWVIASMQKTMLISVLDGITMGGGAGISVHGRFRIATENTVFAMPECAIGLHPDVGMCYVLARLPGGLGTYLGLTGARLKASDVVSAEIATHFVPSHMVPDLCFRLSAVNSASPGAVSRAIEEFTSSERPQPIPNRALIDDWFGPQDSNTDSGTVEDILDRLTLASHRAGEEGRFAQDTIALIEKGCPMSLKVTLEAIKRARDMSSVKECLEMDYRLAVRSTRRPDFYAGVKSAVVTKDKSPIWDPVTLADVTVEDVQNYFKPLSDVNVAEIQLDSESNSGNTTQAKRQSRI
jgi:enoyl-CoA hydratase/carnithine racemase